jgi:hypothetical protein
MSYLPRIRFSTVQIDPTTNEERRRRGRTYADDTYRQSDEMYFYWATRDPDDNPVIDPNGLGPIQILRDAFQKYIIQTPLESNTIGIEIMYLENNWDIVPKTIFLAKRSYNHEIHTYRINNDEPNNNLPPNSFNQINVFRNDQLANVVQELEGFYKILQITICEVYTNYVTTNMYLPTVIPIRILYRNIPDDVIRLTQPGDDIYEGEENTDEENTDEVQIVPAPVPIPDISATFCNGGRCAICLKKLVKNNCCRIMCEGGDEQNPGNKPGHIFHCDCIQEVTTGKCPLCRRKFNSMYRVNVNDIEEALKNSGFGKKKSSKRNNGNSLKSLNNMIKYLECILF